MDYKIIAATDSSALFSWLKNNRYSYKGDEATLKHYIDKEWFFTVMKIDSKQMKKDSSGRYLGEVTPTRFTFSSPNCVYPLRITQLSVKEGTEALFYIQSKSQMDLQGVWSWGPSYVKLVSSSPGCASTPAQKKELAKYENWLSSQEARLSSFQPTRLEWAKKLDQNDSLLLEEPGSKFSQLGNPMLQQACTQITLKEFLVEVRRLNPLYKVPRHDQTNDSFPSRKTFDRPLSARDINMGLRLLAENYSPKRGVILKVLSANNSSNCDYFWYPNREAPDGAVQSLTLLKGYLQRNQWVTKFRKEFQREEMTSDLVFVPLDEGSERTYVQALPGSPP